MKRKTYSLLLALLLAFGAAGCAQDPAENAAPDTSASVAAAEETEAAEEETDDGTVPDDLPEKDFDGAKFSILTT